MSWSIILPISCPAKGGMRLKAFLEAIMIRSLPPADLAISPRLLSRAEAAVDTGIDGDHPRTAGRVQ